MLDYLGLILIETAQEHIYVYILRFKYNVLDIISDFSIHIIQNQKYQPCLH